MAAQGSSGAVAFLHRLARLNRVTYTAARAARTAARLVQTIIRSPGMVLELPYLVFLFADTLIGRRRLQGRSFSRGPDLPQIVMLVISDVARDPRVQREARALADAGFTVKILYPRPSSVAPPAEAPDWGPRVTALALPGYFAYYIARWPYVLGFNLLRAALRESPLAFHAHDLDTAVIALAAAGRTGAYAVCDFHEWYSENVTYDSFQDRYVSHPRFKKTIYRFVERTVLRRASAVITVCDSIANDLARMVTPPRDVAVVRNVPSGDEEGCCAGACVPLRQQIRAEDQFLVLYQGGVGPSRLLEPVIEALKYAPSAHLVIRGPGLDRYQAHYVEVARKAGVADRLTCLPPVPARAVVEAARTADAGLYTVPNLCKNIAYALPNKVFEYLAAGLPLLVADYPEVRRLVERYPVGLLFDPYSPMSIAAAINRLAREPELRRSFADGTRRALTDMKADVEWRKIVEIYRALQPRPA